MQPVFAAPKEPTPTEKRLKFILVASGVLLLLLIFAVGGLELTSMPVFCKTCHEMGPEYVTWKASSHNKLACIDCHIEPGAKKFVLHKIESLSQVYKHLRKEYLLPIQTPEAINDKVCNKCHDLATRIVTPKGDIIIPHDKHLAKKIPCVECHSGVAHGKIAMRQQTIDGDFARWTEAMGEVQMAPRFTTTAMKQCMECHRQRKVAITCETCHKKITLPPNHQKASWINEGEHGSQAMADINGCNRCHSFSKEDEIISGIDEIAVYARTNTFCYDCHRKLPASHDDNWRAIHGNRAQGERKQGCLVCHSIKRPRTSEKATSTFCQECHNSKHYNFNRANHPIKLPPGTKLSKSCTACHNTRSCINCHTIPGIPNQKRPSQGVRR